jgi:hypothetical protein
MQNMLFKLTLLKIPSYLSYISNATSYYLRTFKWLIKWARCTLDLVRQIDVPLLAVHCFAANGEYICLQWGNVGLAISHMNLL